MAGDNYSDQPGDYGMPDMSNGNGDSAPPPAAGYGGQDDQAAQGWIRDWLNGHPVPGADAGAFMGVYQQERQQGTAHDQALLNALRGLKWDQWSPAKTDTGGGGGTGGGLVDAFPGTAPDYLHSPTFTPPGFTKPPAFNYADFVLPSGEDVLKEDPGVNLRLQMGEQALQNGAAAGGVLNTGNTLKDILGYGQNFASQEYGNAVNRKLGVYNTNRANAVGNYNTNYQTQYVDPYKFAYQGALDTFSPQMADWSAHNNFDWNSYLQSYDMFRNRQRDSIDATTALS